MIKLIFVLNFFIAAQVFSQDSIQVTVKGHLRSALNNETSGLAASSLNKGLLYINNDSGDTSRFFLINPDGSLKAIYNFKGDAAGKPGVIDCEDIVTGAGPQPGKQYVYIGDIGDNAAKRKFITVYRTEEPVYKPSTRVYDGQVTVSVLYLKYPDGARDAETMMIDPVEKLLYIVSKREDSVRIYTTPLTYQAGDTLTLTKRASLYFNGFFIPKQITSGDISKDGSRVLLKSYSKVYYWKRKGSEPIWKLMMDTPVELPYKLEHQGESIGFTTSGTGYFTISEGLRAPIYYYKLK